VTHWHQEWHAVVEVMLQRSTVVSMATFEDYQLLTTLFIHRK